MTKFNYFGLIVVVLQIASGIWAIMVGQTKVGLLAFLYALANIVLYFMV